MIFLNQTQIEANFVFSKNLKAPCQTKGGVADFEVNLTLKNSGGGANSVVGICPLDNRISKKSGNICMQS